MISLKELIKEYELYNLTDLEIVELFFVKNKIEDKGVELMNSLAQRQIKYLHEKIHYFKEDITYCSSVLCNDLPDKDKQLLFSLVVKFTYFRDLDENDLNETKRIFDTYDIKCCPVYFVEYLNEKGITKLNSQDFWKTMLEGVIKRRDNQ